VILSPQIKYFLDDLSGRLVGRIFRNRLGILQASFTMLLVCITPSIKTGPADPKIPVSFAERLCGNCVEDGAQAHFLRSAGIQGGIVFQLPYWVMEAGEGKSRHILTYRCKIEGE
jgi:hypothetical protein